MCKRADFGGSWGGGVVRVFVAVVGGTSAGGGAARVWISRSRFTTEKPCVRHEAVCSPQRLRPCPCPRADVPKDLLSRKAQCLSPKLLSIVSLPPGGAQGILSRLPRTGILGRPFPSRLSLLAALYPGHLFNEYLLSIEVYAEHPGRY